MSRLAGELLRDVTRLFSQVQRDGVACCGTTSTQCTLLTELGRNGAMTLAELGRRVGLDKGWTSRAVEGLVKEGLLAKEPSEDDLRTVIIDLTPAGSARFVELNTTLNEQAGRIMARVPRAEQEQVTRALALLAEALRAEAANDPVIISLEEMSPCSPPPPTVPVLWPCSST